MNKKNKKNVEIEVPAGKYAIIKNAEGAKSEAEKDEKDLYEVIKSLPMRKASDLSAGYTTNTTATIASKLVINYLDRYQKDSLRWFSRVAKVTLKEDVAKSVGNTIETKYCINPDKSPKVSLYVQEGKNPHITTPDFSERVMKLAFSGLGTNVTVESQFATEKDLVTASAKNTLYSFTVRDAHSTLWANTLPIGKAVIKSAVASAGGSIAAGAHSVVVVEMNAKASAEYKKSNKLTLYSEVEIDFTARKEKRNYGLGQYSDAVEVTTAANGVITVILDTKPNVFGYGVFVDGRYQGFFSKNNIVLKSLKADTQELSTLLNKDCSVDELKIPGFIELLHNPEQKQFCREFAMDEVLVGTSYKTVKQIDEELEAMFEFGVLGDVLYISADMHNPIKEILYKDITVNVNINSGGTAAAVNFDMSYPHPCDDAHRLEVIVLPELPEGTMFVWSDKMPGDVDWGDIETPFRKIIAKALQLDKGMNERTLELHATQKSGNDMSAAFCFRLFKNCSSKVR